MNSYLKRAKELMPELVENRRFIHKAGGVAFDLRQSADYILSQLKAMGIDAKEICDCGITATIGKGGKTFLIRGDFDALPLAETTGLPFANQNGCSHSCGHDFHGSMMLGAAKLLKENENNLQGTVKLMFQPAEEIIAGAKAMIDAGLLENPHVDAAMAIHIVSGNEDSQAGNVVYSHGATYAAGERFKITVIGQGGHGAVPHEAVDPVTTAAKILIGLQQIVAMEIPAAERVVITFGSINGGTAPNIIPNEVTITGTIRTFAKEMNAFACKRLTEISQGIATTLRAKAVVEFEDSSVPPVINDEGLVTDLYDAISAVTGDGHTQVVNYPASFGSEDFAHVCDRVPGMMINLGAGAISEGYTLGMHNPAVLFDENALPFGAAIYANCATEWLKNNK